MTTTLLTGIGELVTNDEQWSPSGAPLDEHRLGRIPDAAVVIEAGQVAWIGPMAGAPEADRRVDVGGRSVVPGFVDSHTHLVFAGDRSAEFAARMTGERYDGGGIATTVAATRSASEEQLAGLLAARVAELRRQGTTTVEIKSGYGLTVADEARLLRLAGAVTEHTTFLGAHVVPEPFGRPGHPDRGAYLDLVVGEMLEACAPYARWIDVFCEPHSPHAFTADEARAVLLAGHRAGLELRVHGNQLGPGPGVRLACELGAASVDHCTYLDQDDLDALVASASTTSATLLPGVEFSTRSPYPDARRLIDSGASVALATDCNPGTCFTSSMPFVIALAVREMRMSPAEALFAATAGAARALRSEAGRVRVGDRADLALIDAPSYLHLAYRPGVPLVTALELAD